MITLLVITGIYGMSLLYLVYDLKKHDCSLKQLLFPDNFKPSLFPFVIFVVTLPILAIWAFTEREGN